MRIGLVPTLLNSFRTRPSPRDHWRLGALAGVFAAAAGIPLADQLRAAGAAGAGGIPGPVWLGGLGGFFVTEAEAAGAIWSNAGLAAYGGSTGPGVINVLAPDRCPLAQVSSLLSYAAGESAGQCEACMFGLPAVSTQWAEVITRPTSRAVDQFSAGRSAGRAGCLPIPGRRGSHGPQRPAGVRAASRRACSRELPTRREGRSCLPRLIVEPRSASIESPARLTASAPVCCRGTFSWTSGATRSSRTLPLTPPRARPRSGSVRHARSIWPAPDTRAH